MLRKIIGTLGAKTINAVLSLILVTINAKFLGAEGVGVISLIILAITIFLLINNFIGGAALIYLVPRIKTVNLLIPSYLWAFITAIIFYGLLQVVPLAPKEYTIHIVLLGLLQSIATIHLYILLGDSRIHAFNIVTTLQILITVVAVSLFYYLKETTITYFVTALYIAYSFSCLAGILLTIPNISFSKPSRLKITVRRILRHGGFTQVANILQLSNYRLSYYLIEAFLGKAALGIFSVGTQLSEGVLLVSRSISTVQYAHIANMKNDQESQRLTVLLFKLAFIISVLFFSVLILIPNNIYTYIFGKDFSSVSVILLCLFAGIVALAVSNIGTHYFSGIGKHHINSIAAGIGFVTIAIACYILIPRYQLTGAAIATSISYILSALFVVLYFIYSTPVKFTHLLITMDDMRLLKAKLLPKPR